MSRSLAALTLVVALAAACAPGGSGAPPTASPSAHVGGLTQGLVAYGSPAGVGVMDPASGKSKLIAALPAGAAFRLSGPVWGPAPGVGYPLVYFTIHDDRPAESRDSAGVVPYDWLFRADPFTGTIEPVAASQDSFSEGPIGLAGNDHYLALTSGCCADYEVDALDLTQAGAAVKVLARPTDPVTFFTEGVAPGGSGLIAVRAFSSGAWYWLNADAGALNPFPLKLGPDDGPMVVSPDGTTAAIALPDKGALIEPVNVAVPLATPTPGAPPSSSPSPSAGPSAKPSASATPGSAAAPRHLNSALPHPDGLAWSPDGKQLMVAVNGELELYGASAPDGTAPAGRFFTGSGIVGVSWSGAIAGKTFAMVKPGAGPQPMVDALLVSTRLPAAADTPDKRPFTKVYMWQFDSSRPSPISSIADATPAVLARYPPLSAGVVTHHWATATSWEFLGGCYRYRVVITGSIPPVATTIGLAANTLCSAPSSTPRPTAS